MIVPVAAIYSAGIVGWRIHTYIHTYIQGPALPQYPRFLRIDCGDRA